MLCFVSPVPTATTTDATAHHKKFPRAMRKVLRLTSSRPVPCTNQGVDHYLQTECRVDTYFNQNLEFLDRDYDHDEFGDIDNEYPGLTIVECDSVLAAARFLNGYDL
jgi:hypothetical protein